MRMLVSVCRFDTTAAAAFSVHHLLWKCANLLHATPAVMLTSRIYCTKRLLTAPHRISTARQQLQRKFRAMSCTPDIAVTFKTTEAQQEFQQSFKLADGVVASIIQQPATATTARSSTSSCFDPLEFFKHLASSKMGHALMTTGSISSTQEFMRAHANVMPDGTVLVADQQTRGKGRGGNVWTSPDGCLMFTALRRLQVPGEQAAFINYVVCLAVVQGIKQATQHLLLGGLDVQIKWPNDIYYAGVKIGGALIHTTWSSNRFCVMTGIGLNVSNSQPTTCLDDILRHLRAQQQQGPAAEQQLSAAAATSATVSKEQLLAAVLTQLESCFDQFESCGFGPLKLQYLSSWMHSNQQVELEENATTAAGGSGSSSTGIGIGASEKQRVTLTIVGLSPHGFLLAVDALGQEYELTPDGNSLDMMQGLIRKKLG